MEHHPHSNRVTFTVSVVVGLLSAAATGAATWGVYSQRIEQLEERTRDLQSLVLAHDRQLATTKAQYEEIIRRLAQIDDKLENGERRR